MSKTCYGEPVTAFRAPKSVKEALEAAAKKEQKSVSDIVRAAIAEYLGTPKKSI